MFSDGRRPGLIYLLQRVKALLPVSLAIHGLPSCKQTKDDCSANDKCQPTLQPMIGETSDSSDRAGAAGSIHETPNVDYLGKHFMTHLDNVALPRTTFLFMCKIPGHGKTPYKFADKALVVSADHT